MYIWNIWFLLFKLVELSLSHDIVKVQNWETCEEVTNSQENVNWVMENSIQTTVYLIINIAKRRENYQSWANEEKYVISDIQSCKKVDPDAKNFVFSFVQKEG